MNGEVAFTLPTSALPTLAHMRRNVLTQAHAEQPVELGGAVCAPYAGDGFAQLIRAASACRLGISTALWAPILIETELPGPADRGQSDLGSQNEYQ